MVELKYRALDKSENKMIYFSMQDIKDNFGFDYGVPKNLKPVFDDDFKAIEFMPYTGCKDKNGVEIYYGDIVKIAVRNVEITTTVLSRVVIGQWEPSDLEVISNTYLQGTKHEND